MSPGMGSLELAHARISARYGARADASVWRRLQPIRALPALVDATRQSPLVRWMSDLSANSDSHDIEATLRAQWRREVGEVTTWMPDAWQPAVLWWSTWIDLPVLEYLARGEPLLPWMARDTVYSKLKPTSADTGDAGRLVQVLRELMTHPAPLASRWYDAWRAQMPPGQSGVPLLVELYRTFGNHFASFAQAAGDGWPLRLALEKRLVVLFRKALLEPAAVFVYLALTALDLERLRSQLVRRAIFIPRFAAARATP